MSDLNQAADQPERTGRWKTLENWSPTVFIVAGGLLLIPTINYVLEVAASMSFEGPATGIPAFAGIVLSFVGVLGLYPRLADEAPGLARAGIAVVALPAILIFVFLGWGIADLLLPAVPSLGDVLPAPELVFPTIALLFAVGIALLGVASLRTGTPSRTVGLFLLVLAVPWFLILLSTRVYQGDFPAWLDLITLGLMAVALLATGYSLRTGYAPLDRAATPADSTV